MAWKHAVVYRLAEGRETVRITLICGYIRAIILLSVNLFFRKEIPGMNYLVKGWNQYFFLLSPNELEQILKDYHMVIFNAQVPIDYTESSLKEYMTAYSSLYDLLLSGQKIIRERDYPLFLYRGVTTDLSNCTYGNIHLYEGKQYKTADFHEPVVGIAPTALWIHIGEDKKLHCSTSYAFDSEYYMGIQLQYPKMIQYQIGSGFEELKSTKELKTYQDFERLKKSIKEISHIMTLKTPDGIERRTNIRISNEVKTGLNECYLFRQKGITVK